jgi:hypothetical protein
VDQDADEETERAVEELTQALNETAPPPMEPYRSVRTLTRWLVAFVGVQLAARSCNFVAMLLLRGYLDDKQSPAFAAGKLLVSFGSPMVRLSYLSSLVLFCFWLHRAYRNLPALGSRHARFTPGWAVGYFFVPLVVLVRGVQVMRDLWIESQPLPDDGADATERMLRRRAPLVGWWWGLWLATLFTSHTGTQPAHMSRDEWFALNSRVLAASAVEALAAVLFIAVLIGIARRQREQWDDLVRRQPTPPRSDLLR